MNLTENKEYVINSYGEEVIIKIRAISGDRLNIQYSDGTSVWEERKNLFIIKENESNSSKIIDSKNGEV